MFFSFDISIHAPAKGATTGNSLSGSFVVISIHAPAKGATLAALLIFSASLDFNPRSREGSDSNRSMPYAYHVHFNPRSREGSDEVGGSAIVCAVTYFNPRSREGSDGYLFPLLLCMTDISIHAPAKGATVIVAGLLIFKRFQSTLPRRERLIKAFNSALDKRDFNPRSREGSDPGQVDSNVRYIGISIHAPAKGATGLSFYSTKSAKEFQSTLPRRERRSTWQAIKKGNTPFQSTLPRRERLIDRQMCNFYQSISIHAPAKGATGLPLGKMDTDTISIHAPAKGATNYPIYCLNYYFVISIHAPAKGATEDYPKIVIPDPPISIHAPAKGATLEVYSSLSAI